MQHIGVGARSSEAVINNGTAYFAMTPERPYDANLSTGEQARQALARLDARLAKLGSSKSKVMFVTIVLADMASYDEINAVWDNWIDKAAPPARACISAKLANPAMKIELIVQAGVS
jgi:enamine deaminase RidA (YjgF/YER057c/UK114 family)